MSEEKRYLSAREAAEELGVSLPTLYAYVSRGMVRSEAAGGSPGSRWSPTGASTIGGGMRWSFPGAGASRRWRP
jgi:excisionase family DNA binding protein